jgi:hypothetical protein
VLYRLLLNRRKGTFPLNNSLRVCLVVPEYLKFEILSVCYGDVYIYSIYSCIKITFNKLCLKYFYSPTFQIHPISWQVVLSAVLKQKN